MSKQIKLALAFSVALGLPALAQETDAPEVTADTVVATVNGVDITIGHMIAAGRHSIRRCRMTFCIRVSWIRSSSRLSCRKSPRKT